MLEAKTKLSQLVDAAERGEEVVPVRNGVPVAQIVPMPKRELALGFLKDEVPPIPDDLLFAMSDEDADAFVAGTKRECPTVFRLHAKDTGSSAPTKRRSRVFLV